MIFHSYYWLFTSMVVCSILVRPLINNIMIHAHTRHIKYILTYLRITSVMVYYDDNYYNTTCFIML